MEFEVLLISALAAWAGYQYILRRSAERQLEQALLRVEELEKQKEEMQPVAAQLESELKRFSSMQFDVVIAMDSPSDRTAYKRANYAKSMLRKCGNEGVEVIILLFGEEGNETWEAYQVRVRKEIETRKKAKLEFLKATDPARWCAAMNQDLQAA